MHPNIVMVLDFGEQDSAPYSAMEYVAGENVDAALKRTGRFDEARAASIATQVLGALEFAHAEGVVHRDIKPSNILLPKSGPIKVADFGIAHLEQSDLTIDGDVLGTPSYMAPEQLLGGQVDHRADLYATGLLFFEMLTGEKAFQNRQIFDLVRTMREGQPADIWAKHPEVSAALVAVINRALAFDPNERYQTAAEFADTIRAVEIAPTPKREPAPDATVIVSPPAARPPGPATNPPSSATSPPSPATAPPPTGSGSFTSHHWDCSADLDRFLRRRNPPRSSAICRPLSARWRIAVRRAARTALTWGFLSRAGKAHQQRDDRASFIAVARPRLGMPGASPTSAQTQATSLAAARPAAKYLPA